MATFRRRGDRWQAQVRRLGTFESATFDTRAAAELWARRIEHDLDMGRASGTGRGDSTLADLIDLFEREEAPIGRSKAGVLRQLREGLGSTSVRRLTSEAIVAHARRRRKRGAGPATIGLDLAMLGSVLRLANVLLGLRLSLGPLKEARAALKGVGMVAPSLKRDRIASPEEIAALCAYWDRRRHQHAYSAVLCFACITGMRLGEITRLRWADLDERAGTILVRQRKHPQHKADETVPLLFGSLELILAQPRGELIFPVPERSLSTVFPRACRALGIRDLRFHDTRHTAITAMFERGMSIQEVALISGHKSWENLRRYTHIRPAHIVRKYGTPGPGTTGGELPADRGPSPQP